MLDRVRDLPITYTKEDERVLTNLNRWLLKRYDRTIKFKLTEIGVICYVKGDRGAFNRKLLTMLLSTKMEDFDNFEIMRIFRYLSKVKYDRSNSRS